MSLLYLHLDPDERFVQRSCIRNLSASRPLLELDISQTRLEVKEIPTVSILNLPTGKQRIISTLQLLHSYKLRNIFLITFRVDSHTLNSFYDLGVTRFFALPLDCTHLQVEVQRATDNMEYASHSYTRIGNLKLNLQGSTLHLDDKFVRLTPEESRIVLLLNQKKRSVSLDEIKSMLNTASDRNSLRVRIHRLRKKIQGSLGVDPIRNHRGVGYHLPYSSRDS